MRSKQNVHCAIYTRKSTEEGLEQEFNSLDAQREACQAYIASQRSEGWTALPGNYDDGGYSGGTLDRPSLQSLLKEIESGKVDVVVVYKIDRLSRSLMDFSKLVEVFDRKNVTFVSVTQSFNTTTSMGRLTLNILLSFAQFERELTGERIRDKFAASKKKGMWMGGNPPLGYDIENRKLIVNSVEAETVNLIFRRYLDLGSVRALRDDLASRRVLSKEWTSTSGWRHGGTAFDRGALYCLLKNRVYVGETVHKDAVYPGEHQAIVPRETFQAVQNQLTEYRRRVPGKRNTSQDALLAGLLFDEAGTPMRATYSMKPGGLRYRYYASQAVVGGKQPRASISRVPAAPVEDLLLRTLRRLELPAGGVDSEPSARSVLRHVEIRATSVVVELDRAAALKWWEARPSFERASQRTLINDRRAHLASGEELLDNEDSLTLTLPVRARFRGGRTAIQYPSAVATIARCPDAALIKAVARAHHWRKLLASGEIDSVEALAARVGQERRHVGRTLGLAFLSPSLTKSILAGEQHPSMRLTHLLDAELPLSWDEQLSDLNGPQRQA